MSIKNEALKFIKQSYDKLSNDIWEGGNEGEVIITLSPRDAPPRYRNKIKRVIKPTIRTKYGDGRVEYSPNIEINWENEIEREQKGQQDNINIDK